LAAKEGHEAVAKLLLSSAFSKQRRRVAKSLSKEVSDTKDVITDKCLGKFMAIMRKNCGGEKRSLADSGSDSMLDKMLEAPFWNTESSEALRRSAVDLVLFDRVAAYQEAVAARPISLHGEYSIVSNAANQTKFFF
jgi:hypothetical protein